MTDEQLSAIQQATEKEWGIQCRRCKKEEHCIADTKGGAAIIFYDLGWRDTPYHLHPTVARIHNLKGTKGTRITCPTCKPPDFTD